MSYRVLITDQPWSNSDIERAILEPVGCELIEAPDGDEETLIELARDVDAIATCWAHVTANVIEAAQNCKHIARLGIGLDNIDLTAATDRGIPVTNVPDYCVNEVADHALGLLLACARNIAYFHLRTKRGEYDLKAGPTMTRLSEQTLGLVGFGRIARNLREKAMALGLTVIAHSRSGNDYGTGCEMVSFEQLLARSDYVSVHAPLSVETEQMFDVATLSKMKQNACLINTSRGGLVDEKALLMALRMERLRMVALDVFRPEPPDLSQPLFCHERVIVTPHAAFVSEQAVRELRKRVARQVLDVLQKRRPEHIVNPEVWTDAHEP
ncbi:MAG: C-terminal binding protein [Planctomycetaceae bacterium]|nr:C-terminal binding protein [Planctomycetaceae bacterium]